MGRKQNQTKCSGNTERSEERWIRRVGSPALLLTCTLLCGGLAAALAAWAGGVSFGFSLFPLMLCVDLFVFSTVGFFLTDGKKELVYGACSIVSAACAVVQMGIVL